MATAMIQVMDCGKGGITSMLLGDLSGPSSAALTAATFVKHMTTRETILSPCRTYRYTLWRNISSLDGEGYAMFIGLNPSTADEVLDDPTIRRCMAFAQAWGYGALCMTNLFAFRATKPADMLAAADPIGPENDKHLIDLARDAGVVVAAWGTNGTHLGRDQAVHAMVSNLHYLRTYARPRLAIRCTSRAILRQ